jgi:hypothetical protein
MWVLIDGVPVATCDDCFLDDLWNQNMVLGDTEDIPSVEMDDIISEAPLDTSGV